MAVVPEKHMNAPSNIGWRKLVCGVLVVLLFAPSGRSEDGIARHLLYVAEPGIRNYPEDGGTGILVFDIDHGHRFVRRIEVAALGDDQRPEAAKGICASSATGRLYVSTTKTLTCIELATDKVL